jgi:hypothetical protein
MTRGDGVAVRNDAGAENTTRRRKRRKAADKSCLMRSETTLETVGAITKAGFARRGISDTSVTGARMCRWRENEKLHGN